MNRRGRGQSRSRPLHLRLESRWQPLSRPVPWAAKNPVQAYLLYQVMKDLIPGAKKAIGIVKGMPEVE
jgi:hypothetical protein